jgi:TPR repeat protein
MRGYVYALVNSSMPGLVKVGKTTGLPSERVAELSSATGVPTPFVVAFEQLFEDCDAAEVFIHTALERHGLRPAANREFFRAPVADVVRVILSAPQSLGPGGASSARCDLSEPLAGMVFPHVDTTDCRGDVWDDLMQEAFKHEHGIDGYIEDHVEAFRLYRDASRLGCAEAFDRLAFFYYRGIGGIKENFAKALDCTKNAVRRGYYYGYNSMGIFFCGKGHEENFQKSYEKLVAERNGRPNPKFEDGFQYPAALRAYIGFCVRKKWRVAPTLLKEILKTAPYIEAVCGMTQDALDADVLAALRGGGATIRTQAWADIMDEAHRHYFGADACPANPSRAYTLFLEASRLGCPEALGRLGSILGDGAEGVAKDAHLAFEYAKQSVLRGYYYGCETMGNLFYIEGHEVNFHKCYEQLVADRNKQPDRTFESGSRYPSALRRYIECCACKGWKVKPMVLNEIIKEARYIEGVCAAMSGVDNAPVLGWLRANIAGSCRAMSGDGLTMVIGSSIRTGDEPH